MFGVKGEGGGGGEIMYVGNYRTMYFSFIIY